VVQFLSKASTAGSRSICSVLAFEEIAAKIRNEQQYKVLAQQTHNSWREFEGVDAKKAQAERLRIQSSVLAMLEHAIRALSSVSTAVEQPVVYDAAVAGKKLRKAHRDLLRKYPNIDSMDALHIAVGSSLGCKHFISFDSAWGAVAEIELLNW